MSQWYYAHDGKQSGPVPISELQRLAANGEFDPEKDLVWREGLPDWKPASTVPELSSLTSKGGAEESAVPAPAGQVPAEPTPYQAPQSPPAEAAPNKSYAPTGQIQTGFAVASMICGLVALLTCFFICLSLPCAIAAVALGHIALARAKREPTQFGGQGFAKAGLITGYIGLVLTVLYIGFVFWLQSLSPEKLNELEWIPAEAREQLNDAFEQQRQQQ
jgi:hypothetical protein